MSKKKILIPILIITAIIILFVVLINRTTKYDDIIISEDKWNNIITSRVENTGLSLKSLKFNDYNLIIDEGKNTIYYSLINESKSKYNPDVSFIAEDKTLKIAVLSEKITDKKAFNNYEFKFMIYNDTEYRIYNLVCTEFPLLNINYKEKVQNKQKNVAIEMYLFNNLADANNRISISQGKLKTVDNGYELSLHMLTPGKNIRDNKISLFNMKPNNKYILVPADGSNKTTDTNSIEDKHYVELFTNKQYMGLYSLEQNIREWEMNPSRFLKKSFRIFKLLKILKLFLI